MGLELLLGAVASYLIQKGISKAELALKKYDHKAVNRSGRYKSQR